MLGWGVLQRSRPLVFPSPLNVHASLVRKREPTLSRLEGPRLHLVQTWQELASTGSLPSPSLKLKVGPKPMDEGGEARRGSCNSTACQDQHLESFSAAGAPSPSAGVMMRKLGPVSDISFYTVSPAKS